MENIIDNTTRNTSSVADDVSKLYNALIDSGNYNASQLAGGEEGFREFMSSKDNRQAMYQWIKGNNNFGIGPYDEYETRLSSSYGDVGLDKASTAQAQATSSTQPQKPKTIAEQYDRESVGEQLWQPFAKTNEEVEYTPSPVINTEEANKVGAPLSAMDKAVYTANTQALLDGLKAGNKAMEKRLAGIGNQSPTLTEEVIMGEDGPKTIYHTPDGRTFNNKVEATLSMEDTARAIETKSVEGLEQRLARLGDAANERREATAKEWQDDFTKDYEAAKKGSLWDEVAFAMVNVTPQAPYVSNAMVRVESDPEYRAYNAAKVLTEGTINMIREAEKSMADGSGLGAWTKAAGRGFGDTFTDPRTWDLGVGDLLDSSAVLEAAKAFDEAKGDMSKLTPAQRELLNAIAVDTAYRAMYEDAISSGHTAGSITAEALPFIAQMMLGGSSSVAQLVTKGAYKGALKAVKGGIKNKALRYTTKALTKGIGNLGSAAFMTGTFGTGTSLADANKRITGTATPVISESGEIVYGGRKDAEDAGTALRKAYTNTFIEYYSEMLGGSMGDAVDALADVTGVTSLMKKAFKNLPQKTVAPITELIKSGQWHGLFGEYAEEVAGGALNAALVGDVTTDDLLSMDYHKETLEGLLPMSIAFGILGSTSYRTQGYIARKNLRAAQDALRAQGINSIDDLHLTTENTLSQIEEVANNDNFSIAQKQAIITYLKAEQAVLETEKGQQAAEELMSEENITLGRDLEKDLNIGIAAWNSSLDGNNEQVEQIKSEYEEARAQFDEKQLSEIDQLTNNELFEYLKNHRKQARTIWDYLRKRQRYIAIDMAEKDVARAEEKIGAEIEMGRAQGAAITPEEIETKGTEAISALDEISSQLTAKERNDLDNEGISATRKAANPQAAEDYLSAKAYVEGMYEGARSQADEVAQKAAEEVQSRTHADDGQIYTATTNGGESVNVVRGKVALNADGTIDLGASDKGITVVDEAGNKKMISSRELKSLEVANGAEAQQVASEAAKQTYLEKLEALFNAPTTTQLEQQAAELEEEQVQMDAANRAVQQAEIINGSNVAIEVNGAQYPGQVMIVEDGGAVVDFGRPIIYNGRRSRTHQIPVGELTNLDAIAREVESQASAEQPQAQPTPEAQSSASLAEQPTQEEVDYDALLERDPAEFLDKYDAEVGTEVAQGFMKGLIEDTRKAVKAKQAAMKKAVKSPNQYVALKREAYALQGRLELLEEVYDAKYNAPKVEDSASLAEQSTPQEIEPSAREAVEETAIPENQISEQENVSPVENKIAEWSQKLGVPVSVYRSVDEIPNEQSRAAINAGQAVRGWYEPSTGAVAFYLPNLNSEAEVDEVFAHEVVAHKGLRGLLGQEKFDALCDKVWDMMSEADRESYMNYPGVNGDKRAAADEYMAHLAEKVDLTNEERTIWQSIADFVKKVLLDMRAILSDKNIEDLIRMSYRNLQKKRSIDIAQGDQNNASYTIAPAQYTTKKGKVLDMHIVKFAGTLTKEQQRAAKELAKAEKGWYDREQGGFMMRSEESAKQLADTILNNDDAVSDAQPVSLADTRKVVKPQQVNVESLIGELNEKGEAKLSDHVEQPTNPSGNRLVTDERYAELRERMRKKLGGQMNIGIDPEILAIGTEMAVYHLEKGARKFTEYAKAMIADLGDAIRPYLKAFYNGARNLPEVESSEIAADMTPYDEVQQFNVATFDKEHSDPFTTAEIVVAEQAHQEEAEQAKQEIINQRNTERRNEDEQTSASTEAIASQAETVADKAESDIETATTEEQLNDVVATIDKQIEEVNKQLALLGYYEADIDDSQFHESYGYMRSAEKKAVKDADALAKRIVKDLGIDPASIVDKKGKKRKVIAQANIAPAGGYVYIHLPLTEDRELYINVDLEPDYKGGNRDNLFIDHIMLRIENPTGQGYRYVGRNVWVQSDATYTDMLDEIRAEIIQHVPEFDLPTRQSVSDTKQKQPKTKKSKKKAVTLQQSGELGLFDSLFDNETNNEDGLQRNDAIRSEGVSANGNRHEQGLSRGTETSSESEQQDSRGTDLGGERTGDAVDRTVRPRLSDTVEDKGIEGKRKKDVENNRKLADELKGVTLFVPDTFGVEHELSGFTYYELENVFHFTDNINGQRNATRKELDAILKIARKNNGKEEISEPKNTRNNHSERGKDHAPTSVDARIEANIKAIELAKQLLESGEQATEKQMQTLRKFSGWGGLGKAFSEGTYYAPNNIAKRLRELLGEAAYQEAVMSANSAYYTPAYVVDTLWDIAEQMGFKGGNILEGSAGIGNILGQMPTHISERSDIHAIEIDGTSGSILSLLYPDAKVEIQGFEETRIANGSVDLAITNVPFVTGLRVNDTTGDKDLSKKFHNIHDFCIAKNVRKLREGGLGIFITSNGTLDNSKKLRDWIVNEGGADFVGAFRMHNKTFGGTGVTSDIIVIRKRVNGKKSANAIDVSTVSGERVAEYDTGETRKVKGQIVPVVKQLSMDYNQYFIEHPENMAGEMHFAFEKGDTFRPTSKGLYPKQDKKQEQMLADFVQSFTAEEFGKKATDEIEVIDAMPGKKIGEVFVSDGKLYINAIGAAQPLEVNANKVKGHTKVECFEAYSAIKEALSEVLEYQITHEDDKGLKPLLAKLNKAYDDFVAAYGHFNKNTAIAFLRNDVEYANVASVETYEEIGDGKGGIKQTFGKADVMKERVVEKEKEPAPTNVKDGIVASIFKYGRIDVPYIAEHLNKSAEEVKQEIIESGYGFEDPATRQVEVSYQYLSGNVREKLRQAQENNENGEFDRNIKALQEVVPMDIPAHLIDFTLGSSWIEPKLYEEYVKERTDVGVQFTAVGGTWFMNEPYYTAYEKNRAMGVTSEMLGRTVMGHTLIEAAIQNRSITVSTVKKNWDGSTETITDKEATQACAAKIDEIRQDFKEWARQKMQSDAEISERMERIYNDTFNNYVPMSIPDDFVPEYFGGASHKFKMRPHQGRAIVRGTMQPLLLAHEVGTGKTFTLISTAMEMRRLGTARKPMIAVQNATVGQFVASAKELYPNAKILTLEEADRSAEGRKNFYAKIRYNDWDMIVVPQSTFEFIPDSEERQMTFVQEKIEEKMLVLEKMKEADPNGNDMITRQAEREIAALEEQLAELSDGASKKRTAADEKKRAVALQNAEVKAMEMLDRRTDDVENFDDMGIDALLIDEAHEYKHLGFATAMQRGVKGVDPSYSKKSQGVFLKTQAVLEKNNGRNVIFATGTPISNTAAEIWTFMRYLMPADTMEEYGIYYFDDFVRNFGNIQQMLEFTTSGKFKENNRFAGYVNLPELVRIWSGVSDTVLTKEAGGVSDKIPDMEGGKAQDLYLPQTRALRSIMKYVKAELERYDKMSGKAKKENSHIPLTMYGIAKAAAVDARLVQSDAEDDTNSKTNEAVRQTLRSLQETADYKGTVAIFADNYQNKESGFNLYEDIRAKLIAEGVPANEIVVMKSGMTVKKKLEIFEKVNRGEVRVILGSTFTLGTGVNIQERLHTLIHLDAPNRPMDYTQRNGRILRQGNLHKAMGKPVRILRFGVEDSLDVTAYQRLKTKGAIADSIMNGKQMMANSMTNRVLEEEEDVFGDTVAQLSGSEYAMLKNNAEKNVRKYASRKKQWEADQTYIHNAKPRVKAFIKDAEKRIEDNSRYLEAVRSSFPDGKFKEIVIGKHRFTTIDAMEDFLKEHNKSLLAEMKQMKDGEIAGEQKRQLTIQIGDFSFVVTTKMTRQTVRDGATLFNDVERKMTYSCAELGIEDIPVRQNLLRNAIEDITHNVITGRDFSERLEAAERSRKHNEAELEQLLSREGKPFEYEAELEQAKAQYEEYAELMKKELEQKEAKYADIDASVETADGLTHTQEEELGSPSIDGNTRFSITEDSTPRLTKDKVEKNFGGIWIDDKQEFAKFASAVNNYAFEENGEGIAYTDNYFYAYYRNIDGQAIPFASVYLNAAESQDVVKTIYKEIEDGLRKGSREVIDRIIDFVGSTNGSNNAIHSNDKGISQTRGNASVGSIDSITRKGRYYYAPDLFVKTQRADRFGNIEGSTRFSVATTPSEEQYSVKEAYDNRLSKRRTKLREEMMDDGIAIKILQDLIAEETGEPIADIANVYLHRNHMNSRSTQEIGYYEQKFGERIMEALRKFIKRGAKLKDIEKYLIAKHGLERNDYMNWREAVRKAAEQKRKRALKDYDNLVTTAKELGLPKPESKVKSVGEYEREYFAQYNEAIANLTNEEYTARRREIMNSIVPYNFSEGRDQSGLTETLGYDPKKEDAVEYDVLTEEAHRIVEQFESEYNTAMIEELWDSIKASAGFSLTKNRNTGQISNEYHDNASKMYRYYVPLRGWEKDKAEDVYAYEDVPNTGTTNRADLKAAGRRSKPDSPFATLANMAYTAIVQGNKNRANMSLLNLARMYPSDALSVHRIWEVLDEDTGDWVVAEPKLTTYNTPQGESSNEALNLAVKNGDTVAADLAAYEEEMKALQKEGKARPITGKIDSHLHFTNQQLKQHAVTVRVNGTPYIVWVNGNPRVAQTLNGLTRKHLNAFERGAKAMTRWLSGVFTSKNPAFWIANGSRDLWYSEYRARTMFGMEYAARYTKNYGIVAAKIWELQRNGQLNAFEPSEDIDKIQQYYNEFIRNGGPTGYAYLKDVQKTKEEMQTALKDMEKSVSFRRGWEKFNKNMDAISGTIETIPRLAAYITSRESGRSILDSISDAKEVTTNFDRKGGRLNQSFGVAWAFFNASVQGVQNFLNTVKEHPVKATMEIAGRAALGVYGVNILNMALAALFGDDPDEVMDQYFALSDYTRRHNLCFYIGGDWVKIPLPQTLRVFYGIGDIINKATHGYAHYDDIPSDIASLLGDFFPINLVGAEDWRTAAMPTALSPIVEVFYTNTDYAGRPIANQTIFNEHLPEWQRTYGDESAPAVLISRALSRLSGGSKYKRGAIEFNPAYIDHLVKGYLGGVGTFITKGANTIEWGAKELAEKVSGGAYQNPEEFMWRGTPISSRLLQDAPTGDNNFRLNQAYSYWRDFYEKHNTQKKGYEDELESGNLEDVDDFIKVMMDEGTMDMFHDLDREIRKLYKEKDKLEDPDAVASVNDVIKNLKQRAVQMMEDEYFGDKKKPVFQERLRKKEAKQRAEEKKRKASEE